MIIEITSVLGPQQRVLYRGTSGNIYVFITSYAAQQSRSISYLNLPIGALDINRDVFRSELDLL